MDLTVQYLALLCYCRVPGAYTWMPGAVISGGFSCALSVVKGSHQLLSPTREPVPDAVESNMLPCFIGLLPTNSSVSPSLCPVLFPQRRLYSLAAMHVGCVLQVVSPRASWDHKTQQACSKISSKAPLNGGWTCVSCLPPPPPSSLHTHPHVVSSQELATRSNKA